MSSNPRIRSIRRAILASTSCRAAISANGIPVAPEPVTLRTIEDEMLLSGNVYTSVVTGRSPSRY